MQYLPLYLFLHLQILSTVNSFSYATAIDELTVRNVHRHPPSVLQSCAPVPISSEHVPSTTTVTSTASNSSSSWSSLPLLFRVVVHNVVNFPILLSWIDYYGIDHPRYIIPSQCTRYILAPYGSSWRIWPLPFERNPVTGNNDECTSPFSPTTPHARLLSPTNYTTTDTEPLPSKLVGEFTVTESAAFSCESPSSRWRWARNTTTTNEPDILFLFPIRYVYGNSSSLPPDKASLSLLPQKYSPRIRRLYHDYFQSLEALRDPTPDYILNPPVEVRFDYGSTKSATSRPTSKYSSFSTTHDHSNDCSSDYSCHGETDSEEDIVKEILNDLKRKPDASFVPRRETNDHDQVNPLTKTKASLFLRYKNIHYGQEPNHKHPGLHMMIKKNIRELMEPGVIRAKFVREEICPYCHYTNSSMNSSEDESSSIVRGMDGIPEKIWTETVRPHERLPLEPCPYCHGDGIVRSVTDHLPTRTSTVLSSTSSYSYGVQTIRSVCSFCQGLGTVVQHPHNTSCTYCKNRRYDSKLREIEFILPAGMPSNYQKVLPKEGGIKLGTQNGPLTIQVASADTFNDPLHQFYKCSSSILRNHSNIQPPEMDTKDTSSRTSVSSTDDTVGSQLRLFNVTRIGLSEIYTEIHPFATLHSTFTYGPSLPTVSFLGTLENLLEQKYQSNLQDRKERDESIHTGNHPYSRVQNSSRTSAQIFEFLPVSRTLHSDDSGPHLRMDIKLSMNEAIEGIPFAVVTPRGILRLDHLRPPFFPGDVFVVPGGGLPVYLPSFCVWNHTCKISNGISTLTCLDETGKRSSPDYPSVDTLMEDCSFRTSCNTTFLDQWQLLYKQYSTLCTKSSIFPSIEEITDTWNQTIFNRNYRGSNESVNDESASFIPSEEAKVSFHPNSSYPPTRTTILCSPINDTIVHAYPHGHLFIGIDVDLRNTLPYFLSASLSSPSSLTVVDIIQKMYTQSKYYRRKEPSSKYMQRRKDRITTNDYTTARESDNTGTVEPLAVKANEIVESETITFSGRPDKPWKKRSL